MKLEQWYPCNHRKTEGRVTWVCNREKGHLGHHCQFARDASWQERNVWWQDNDHLKIKSKETE